MEYISTIGYMFTRPYIVYYSTLYGIWGEYQLQSVCVCSSDSCPIIDLRC